MTSFHIVTFTFCVVHFHRVTVGCLLSRAKPRAVFGGVVGRWLIVIIIVDIISMVKDVVTVQLSVTLKRSRVYLDCTLYDVHCIVN